MFSQPCGRPWPGKMPVCWCVTDGKPGLVNQALGLAEAMGLEPVVKRVSLRAPWRIASPPFMMLKALAFSPNSDSLAGPWPDIVIGSGRPSILPLLYIKEQSRGLSFAVQVQDPVMLRSRFDLIVAPVHDALFGDNIVAMTGAMHRVTPARLTDAADAWRDRFAPIPRPAVAVMIGGSNSRYRLQAAEMSLIAQQLRQLSKTGYGLILTASRRTGLESLKVLRNALADCQAFIWDGEGDNPYYAMLGTASAIIVTGDSVNMISEACATSKPVYVIQLPLKKPNKDQERNKFASFHRDLRDDGYIRFFTGKVDDWSHDPLRERERVAEVARQTYERWHSLRGSSG